MRYLFSDYEDACDNTLLIAERVNIDLSSYLNPKEPRLPQFPIPEGIEGETHREKAANYLRTF
jgi:DNA polymerase-3 subunit alpha